MILHRETPGDLLVSPKVPFRQALFLQRTYHALLLVILSGPTPRSSFW